MVVESILVKLAEKVADRVLRDLTGKPISNLLEDQKKRSAFKKAISESFHALVDKGFEVGTQGALYEEFFLDGAVVRELWLKVVDPACNEEIGFDLLEKKFKECWQAHIDIDKKAGEGIRYFCNTLESAVFHHSELRDLLNTKILRELRDWISFDEIERLKKKCLEYIKTTKQDEFQKELGKGNDYVEPALERKAERPAWEKKPPGPQERKKKIEEDTYFAPISIAEIVRRDKNDYVLVSESGMGKTAFLKCLELSISKGELSKDYLPVYVHLSILKDYTTQDQLISRLATEFSNVADDRKFKQFIKAILKQGKFLFLLDGLDQVPDTRIISQLLQRKEIFRNNKIIIATRQIGYGLISSQLRNYKFIQLVPFDQKRIQEYLKAHAENPKVKEIIRQNREFAQIPILLQMISRLLTEDAESLSEIKTRSHLYEKYIDYLFEHEKEVKTTKLSAEKRKLDLKKLSYDLIDRDFLGSFPEKEGYKVLEEDELNILLDWGILNRLIERTKNQIGFRHQSFQEYFASSMLKEKILNDGEINRGQFEQHLEYKKWDQSFLFLIGQLDEYMAKNLIREIEGFDPFFAGLCVSHHPGKKEEFKDLIEKLFSLWENEIDEKISDILARINGDLIVNRFVHLIKEHKHYWIRAASAVVLGEIGDTRVIDQLTNVLKDKKENRLVRQATAMALGKIGDSRATHTLIEASRYKYVKRAATKAIREIRDPKVIDVLIKTLQEKDSHAKLVAARALGETGDTKAVDALVTALKDKNLGTRLVAAGALGEIQTQQAVVPLTNELRDKDWNVRRAAAEALGKIGDSRAVDPLKSALKDEDCRVRQTVVGALGKIGDQKAVHPLIRVSDDQAEDQYVRFFAIQALGEIGDPNAVEPLIRILKDRDKNVRRAAAKALGKIRDTRAVDSLINALNDKVDIVRRAAAMALGRIEDPKAVDALINTLKDKNQRLRWRVAWALGKIGDPAAVLPLTNSLKDESEHVRWDAAWALGKIGGLKAVDALTKVLKDKNEHVKRVTATGLTRNIGYEKLMIKLKKYGQEFLSRNRDLIKYVLEKSPKRFLKLGLRYWEWLTYKAEKGEQKCVNDMRIKPDRFSVLHELRNVRLYPHRRVHNHEHLKPHHHHATSLHKHEEHKHEEHKYEEKNKKEKGHRGMRQT